MVKRGYQPEQIIAKLREVEILLGTGFGDDALASSLTDRINNEFSHLAGVFERSVLPIDASEMKTTAIFILRKIKKKDPDQYAALLQGIGVNEISVGEPQAVVEA